MSNARTASRAATASENATMVIAGPGARLPHVRGLPRAGVVAAGVDAARVYVQLLDRAGDDLIGVAHVAGVPDVVAGVAAGAGGGLGRGDHAAQAGYFGDPRLAE